MIIDETRKRPEDCVYIPIEEYRDLVRAKRDAECIKAVIQKKYLSYEELELLVRMYCPQEEAQEENTIKSEDF